MRCLVLHSLFTQHLIHSISNFSTVFPKILNKMRFQSLISRGRHWLKNQCLPTAPLRDPHCMWMWVHSPYAVIPTWYKHVLMNSFCNVRIFPPPFPRPNIQQDYQFFTIIQVKPSSFQYQKSPIQQFSSTSGVRRGQASAASGPSWTPSPFSYNFPFAFRNFVKWALEL